METEVCTQSQLNTAQRKELEAVSWKHEGSRVVQGSLGRMVDEERTLTSSRKVARGVRRKISVLTTQKKLSANNMLIQKLSMIF